MLQMFLFTSIGFVLITLFCNWLIIKIYQPAHMQIYKKYSYWACGVVSASFPITYLYNVYSGVASGPFRYSIALLWLLIAFSLFTTQYLYNMKLKK